jgi:hypothetical protein
MQLLLRPMCSGTDSSCLEKAVPVTSQLELPPLPIKSAFIMFSAFSIFFALIILQIIAIYASATGKVESDLKVSWCSPIFQPFGLSVLDGNGKIHPILDQNKKGIGCIPLEGVEQKHWLRATLVIVSLSVVLELGDLIFLICMSSESKFNGVRLRRPWLTVSLCLRRCRQQRRRVC